MISITQETIGGTDVYLVLAEPNTDDPSRLSIAYDTSLAETDSGVESRRPRRSAPLLQYQYTVIMDELDMATWRQLMGIIGRNLVAVAFWPDSSDYVDPGSKLFDPRVRVGFNSGFADIAIAEGGAMPTGETVLPLIIGRLRRRQHDYFLPATGRVSIAIEEDSPWSQRLDIASAGPASWDFSPAWVGPERENTKDNLELDNLGEGREMHVEGDEIQTWVQSASFALARGEARKFLGWFRRHRGRMHAFTMPSFFTPGSDTPIAPHVYDGTNGRGFCRFGSDVLKLEILHPGLFELKAEFEQVLDTVSEEHFEWTRLFEIWSEADPGDVARLTSRGAPLVVDGHVWNPARVHLAQFVSSLKIEDDTAKIEVDIGDLPQITPILRHETDIPVRCRILQADLSTDPASTTVLTAGVAQKWKLEGQRAEFSVEPFSGILNRSIPRFSLCRNCNHSLFDAGCTKIDPAAMAKTTGWSPGLSGPVLQIP